jgi:hypothetical protein
MSALDAAAGALGWLGRQGTRAIAASIFLGLAVPPLAAFFRPYVPEAIFAMLVLAFLRVEPKRLRSHVSQPGLVIAATAWMMIATPALMGGAFLMLGLKESAPGLFVALILQASSAPLTVAPAYAAILGLDAALTLATLVLTMIVTPFTAPAFAHFFAGEALTISAASLGLKLLLLLAGSAGVAALIRWFAGSPEIERQRDRIDGFNVVVLFVFAVAVMDGVALRFVEQPLFVIGLIALAFVLTAVQMASTALVFAAAGKERALALGLTAANRNLGLMLAASGGLVPPETWLYFGLAQFPIYLVPLLIQPLARRVAPPPSP